MSLKDIRMIEGDKYYYFYEDGEIYRGEPTLKGKLQNMHSVDDGRSILIMTMEPICIKSEYKRKGYGKILLAYSLEKSAELGC